MKGSNIEKLQLDLDYLGEWAVKILLRARVQDLQNYCFGDQIIPEANSCKYLGVIFRSYLRWADQVN
jgi:hypothetical protein